MSGNLESEWLFHKKTFSQVVLCFKNTDNELPGIRIPKPDVG